MNPEKPMGITALELLSSSPIKLDWDEIYQSFKNQFHEVIKMDGTEERSSLQFGFPEYTVQYQDGALPAQIILMPHTEDMFNFENYAPHLQQTWGWNDAESVVSNCKYSFSVLDVMARGLHPHQRRDLIHKALLAILDRIDCDAICWQPSQQFINPDEYIENAKSDTPDLLYGFLNVRLFNIQDSNPQAYVMDTMGLALWGLPDIQCHFIELEPNQIARLLGSVGYYLFEKGDIIQDGETVQGLTSQDYWECQHEMALVAPEREVLDINPGSPYAAGNRE